MEIINAKYVLSVIILTTLYINQAKSELECYRCQRVRADQRDPFEKPIGLCKDFDYSEKFIVKCPYSTFCSKTTYSGHFDKTEVNLTERGCALQKDMQHQYDFTDRKWRNEVLVKEPYEEGCSVVQDKGTRLSQPIIEHCYCRGSLCNKSVNLVGASTAVMVFLITTLWVM